MILVRRWVAMFLVGLFLFIPMIQTEAKEIGSKQDEPIKERTVVKTGHIKPGGPNFIYVPFEIPKGVTELTVRYDYNREEGNALDIGIFDPDGYDIGNKKGFRGWSGGARSEFTISRSEATPGYLPGDIEPGTWNVILGPYQVAPKGIDWKIEVNMRFGQPGPKFKPDPAPQKLNKKPGWYRGDLHMHTIYSDGKFTPEQVVSEAIKNGLDFIVSTEHNTIAANNIWGKYANSNLLVLNGEEVTTRAGHWGAIGLSPGNWIDFRYLPKDNILPRMISQVHKDRGLAVANHPFATCKACNWQFGYDGLDAIEVWNADWDATDEQALKLWDSMLQKGKHITAVGASDAHRPPNVIGHPQTVVRSEGLSRDDIMEGIRKGRVYIAESHDVQLDMKAQSGEHQAGIGDHLTVDSGTPVNISLRVKGAPGTVATFYTEDGRVQTVPITDGDKTVTWSTKGEDTHYIRAEIRKPDGTMVALTNPIWIGR